MKRLLSALVATLAIVSLAPAADAKKLVLRWHGQSFFELETSAGTRVVFDPHAIDAYGRITIKKADLICVSTHGRTGLAHLLLGSVAEKIVRHAPCPVLVVRPTQK